MTAPQTVADVLDKAATRLEQPGAWAQGDFAFTAEKKGTYGENENAVCWCALGAIAYELRDKGGTSSGYYDAAANELQHHVGDVPDFNDAPGRTQSEVVAALRAAATSARQETRHGE